MKILIKIFYLLRNGIERILLIILDLIIRLNGHIPWSQNRDNLLLVRTDAIGDYILFRNFIEILKGSSKYRNYSFFLLGNEAYKDIALTYDKKDIKGFFWINTKRLWESKIYQRRVLLKFSFYTFQTLLNSSYSRSFFLDQLLISKVRAKQKIGFESDLVGSTPGQLEISDKYYTELISADNLNKFEFDRNKEFYEKLLNSSIPIRSPFLNLHKKVNKYKRYRSCIVIFPGASQEHKQWGAENFSLVIKHVLQNTSKLILIAGSREDHKLANLIIKNTGVHERLINITGQTNLTQLADLLSIADLLISNDTVAVHIAAAVGLRVISILNGQHYGRFCPYPDNPNVIAIYPPEIEAMGVKERLLKFQYASAIDIKSIKSERVIETIKEIYY